MRACRGALHSARCTLLCTHFAPFAAVRRRSLRAGRPAFWLVDAKHEHSGTLANVNPQNS